VERALERPEVLPAAARVQWLHALLAALLGGLAWLVGIVGMILVVAGMVGSGGLDMTTLIVGTLLFIGSGIPSLLGVGFGASAIGARGNHLILATIGVLVSGLHLGVLVGLFTFAFWQQ
jgi:hypothetical protein